MSIRDPDRRPVIVPCDAVGPDGPNGEFIEDKIILDDVRSRIVG